MLAEGSYSLSVSPLQMTATSGLDARPMGLRTYESGPTIDIDARSEPGTLSKRSRHLKPFER